MHTGNSMFARINILSVSVVACLLLIEPFGLFNLVRSYLIALIVFLYNFIKSVFPCLMNYVEFYVDDYIEIPCV